MGGGARGGVVLTATAAGVIQGRHPSCAATRWGLPVASSAPSETRGPREARNPIGMRATWGWKTAPPAS